MVIETNMDDDDGYDSNDLSDHEVEDFSDLDLNEVPDDIDDESTNDDENLNMSLVGSSNRGIVIHNDPWARMWNIDLDAMHASEFLEYLDIVPAHRLAVESGRKEIIPITIAEDGNWNLLSIAFAIMDKENMKSCEFFLTNLRIYILQADNLDAKNGVEKSNKMDARYVFFEDVRKIMDANHRRSRSINVEIYSQQFKTFRVTRPIDCRPSIPLKFYGVDF
ncbi:hypothetical protein PVK06_020687 [Gossypium arboreum]|uniref:Uncharacterized protein n=1 Tax=Gossypium arboreum TaxID=29729 RepID=A0ABR0PNI7_GOSAR|nr:hypothetical protein PVK06_020687 [Gossypium arboreum]